MSGLNRCISFVCESAYDIDSNQVMKLWDSILACVMDSNTKVNLKAFQSIVVMVPHLKDSLEPVMNRLMQAVTSALGSTNTQVRSVAHETFDALTKHLKATSMLPLFPVLVQQANSKLKPILVEKLIGMQILRNSNIVVEVTERAHSEKPLMVTKFILPLCLKMMKDSNRTNLRPAVQLLHKLCALLGEDAVLDTAQTMLTFDEYEKVKLSIT